MTTTYLLQNKNIPLIEFSVSTKRKIINNLPIISTEYKISKIYNESKKIFPKNIININSDSIKEWISDRKIPKNRQFVNKILSAYENCENPLSFVDITHALSLNDTFWINNKDYPLKWEDCNLYSNKFDKILAYVAFTGYAEKRVKGIITSPEFTTGGAQKKCWVNRADGVFLLKGCSELYAAPERSHRTDVVTEYCASQVAEAMNFEHVNYDIELFTHHDNTQEPVSVCKLFTSEDEGYLPFYIYAQSDNSSVNLANTDDYETEMELAKLYGQEKFEDMMVFDALILNTDRHMNNYGMIFDTNTGDIIKPAPLFDHGMSLLVGAAEQDLFQPQQYISTIESKFGISFDEQAYRFIQKRHIKILKDMQKFKFTGHPLLKNSDEYIYRLNEFIKNRAKYLIELYECKKRAVKKIRSFHIAER